MLQRPLGNHHLDSGETRKKRGGSKVELQKVVKRRAIRQSGATKWYKVTVEQFGETWEKNKEEEQAENDIG